MTTDADCGGVVSEVELDPEAIVVDKLFRKFWFEWGAQLCNFEFYSRHIPPLQDAYGCEAVAAALHRHQAMLCRQYSDQISGLRENATRLKYQTLARR
jgi:hypothetical protein